ncbi:endonuclease/exonuclease/phosphatase family protein [Rhodopseudomonas palustris]
MGTLRVGSLNTGLSVWKIDLQQWRLRAAQLSKLIGDLSLDVVLLQEIWRIKWDETTDEMKTFLTGLGLSGDQNKDDVLAAALGSGFQVRSSLVPSFDRGRREPGLYWGLTIVSRFPIEQVEKKELSYSKFDRWPRIAQSGKIKLANGDSSIFVNVHLPAESHESRLGLGLETLSFSRSLGAPTLCIGGDMNAGPQAGPVQIFMTEYSDCWSSGSTRVVKFEGNESRAGSALYRTVAEGRIDYLLADKMARITSSTYLYGDYGSAPLSDHPFVIAEIESAPGAE